jgi:chromosome segregation ATPase
MKHIRFQSAFSVAFVPGFVLAAIGVALAGCTTVQTDPRKVSTADLLWGHGRLEAHVASRTAHLAQLKSRAEELEQQVIVQLGRLHRAQQDLAAPSATEAASRARRNELMQQLQSQKAKAESILNRSLGANRTIEKLKNEKITLDEKIRTDLAATDAATQAVKELEEENKVLDQAIVRTLQLKTEQLLRQ